MTKHAIRPTTANDTAQILALYPKAFPDEDLIPLVTALLREKIWSIAAFDGQDLIGHAVFSPCSTHAGADGALLGPLAVAPDFQKQGVGRALIQSGFDHVSAQGVGQVLLLGDPGYYGRFGFHPERKVLPPYELPDDWSGAWQSIVLPGRAPMSPGPISLPGPWMRETYWRP